MVNLKNLKTDRKKLGLFVSGIIIIIGVIPLLILTFAPELKRSYTIQPLPLETEDGVYISAFIYKPLSDISHGGVIVGHGFFGNKLNMQPLSIELAKRGFTVINLDFRGHGASSGAFYRSELIKDMKAAVEYFESDLPYITDIGLVGHSLGAEIAVELSKAYPNRINATVVIGGDISNITGVSNLLITAGLYDPGLNDEKIIELITSYTGLESANVGEIYWGNFTSGVNIRGYISPFSGHITEVIDTAIIYETVQWFEQAFNGKYGSGVIITATILQIFSYVSLIGVIAFNVIMVVYISNYFFKRKSKMPDKNILKGLGDISIRRLIAYYTIPVVVIQFIFFLGTIEIPTIDVHVSSVNITLSLIIGAAIGTYLVSNFLLLNYEEKFFFRIFPSKLKKMCSLKPGLSLFYGTMTALLLILSIAAVWHWSVQNTLPTLIGIGRMILITLISFPFLLIREFYFRSVQERLRTSNQTEEYLAMVCIGVFMDNLVVTFIIFVGRIRLAYIPAEALYLLVWVIFSIIQNLTVTWIYINSGRNILGSTIFTSIFYSWMLVVFFPSYGFL
ncbi:MAG: alpha/beta hydrolase family protein [Promethearchaeota archaeon]